MFAHWRVPVAVLGRLVPSQLTIQEFDGTSWVGIVPFNVEGLSARFAPDVPTLSNFPEVNLRLYVEAEGRPGVWFVSLDAGSRLAVLGARAAFSLPYYRARFRQHVAAAAATFTAERLSNPAVRLAATYRPIGEEFEARPGSLEHFLTERYCLYTRYPSGRIARLEIQHPPWRLRQAEAEIRENTLAELQGIPIDKSQTPVLHFSAEQNVVAWWPRLVD